MKISLNCIILFVHDIEKIKGFYIGSLGLTLIEEISGEWVLLSAGECTIGLHKAGARYEAPAGRQFEAHSNAKLVFELQDDIFKLRETLVSTDVFVTEIKTFPNYNYWLCDGKDPEGNVFQLKQKMLREV